jgi:hypothetical protein
VKSKELRSSRFNLRIYIGLTPGASAIKLFTPVINFQLGKDKHFSLSALSHPSFMFVNKDRSLLTIVESHKAGKPY